MLSLGKQGNGLRDKKAFAWRSRGREGFKPQLQLFSFVPNYYALFDRRTTRINGDRGRFYSAPEAVLLPEKRGA